MWFGRLVNLILEIILASMSFHDPHYPCVECETCSTLVKGSDQLNPRVGGYFMPNSDSFALAELFEKKMPLAF
jgi:hypothetical protein